MSALHWNFVIASYAIFAVLILIDWLLPMWSNRLLRDQIRQRLRREQAQVNRVTTPVAQDKNQEPTP